MTQTIKALETPSALVPLVATTRAGTDEQLARIWLQKFKSQHTRRAY